MEKAEKLNAYYHQDHPFKQGIARLRELALQSGAQENFKWSFPVYTLKGKNVFGICKFKHHFGVWFFNGVFMKDPKNVLENAQEGKTKGMRHWKFNALDEIDEKGVYAYMLESLENQEKGLEVKAEKTSKVVIPEQLQSALNKNRSLQSTFEKFTPYKQKEFCEYIAEAKQESTKIRRLEKILTLIEKGVGLNDGYR